MKRIGALFLGFLISVAILCQAQSSAPVGVILEGRGDVQVRRGNKSMPGHKNFQLRGEDEVTTDAKSGCLIDFSSLQAKLRLAEKTTTVLSEKVTLLHGFLWVRKEAGLASLQLKSLDWSLAATEADYYVKVQNDGTGWLAVRSGLVVVDRKSHKWELGAKTEMHWSPSTDPRIRGLNSDELVEWGEPFEEY